MARLAYALAMGLLLAALGSCGGGTTRPPRATAPRHPAVSERDRTWLTEIHQANLAEIQTGTIAETRGHDPAVRSAAHKIVTDHTHLDADVSRTAGRLGVQLPRTPAPDQVAAKTRLDKKSGTQFDHDFVTTMIAGHQQAITKTQAETSGGSAPEVTQLAKSALPKLHQHQDMLRSIARAG